MRCERCRNRNATYHITTVVHGSSGSTSTLNLCPACAKAAGFDDINASFEHPSAPPLKDLSWEHPELDPIALYLKQMEQMPALSLRQERALFRRLKGTPDEERAKAAVKIVEAHLRLVIAIAKKHSAAGRSFLDTIQAGSLALLSALKRFDPKKDGRFADFASPRIQRALARGRRPQRLTDP